VTIAVVRRLVSVDYACLVNLIVNRAVVPEFLQEACTPDRLEAAVARILVDRSSREVQIEAAREVRRRLFVTDMAPSHRAAQVVLDVLGRRETRLASASAGK
jgi:lipid-A-disaccharide synthase